MPPSTGRGWFFPLDAEPNKPIALTKYITYHTSSADATAELARAQDERLTVPCSWVWTLLDDQRTYLDDFWHRSDIQISAQHPRLQQCLRWNLFQLIQASGRADDAGIPAKGLTGQTYDGHYFWDMEMYVLPFLIYTSPKLGTQRLAVPLQHPEQGAGARPRGGPERRAISLAHHQRRGGSAYYAAGTAQYHINAAIAHGIVKYVDVTGDQDFLLECGAEMLVETARLWFDLGFFSPRQGGNSASMGLPGRTNTPRLSTTTPTRT